MEKKKFDLNSIIGFALIFGMVDVIMSDNRANKKSKSKKPEQEKIEKQKKTVAVSAKEITAVAADSTVSDSTKIKKLQSTLGSFAYSATLPTAKEGVTVLENDFVKISVNNKGGAIAEVELKKFRKVQKNSGELVALIKNNNANFNIELQTADNRVLNTKDLFF